MIFVAVAQLLVVRPHRVSGFFRGVFRCGVRVRSQIAMSKISEVSLGLARAGFARRASAARPGARAF